MFVTQPKPQNLKFSFFEKKNKTKKKQRMLNSFRESHREELGEDGILRVCIGGGAGFIGSHIAKRLKEEVRKKE